MVQLSPLTETERNEVFFLLFKRDFPRHLKKELDPGDISRWIPHYEFAVSTALRLSPVSNFNGSREALSQVYSFIKAAESKGSHNFFPIFFTLLGDIDSTFMQFIRKLGLQSIRLESRAFATEIIPTKFEFGDLYLRYTLANVWRLGSKVIKHPGGILYWHLHPSTRGLIR